MALPLHTVPHWVPNIINPKILFVTENYPGYPDALAKNTFFYRALNPVAVTGGANNLLNNLCTATGITETNEHDKLNRFMNVRNYFLIDTFASGPLMSNELIAATIRNPAWVNQIIDDIVLIRPEQIVFTCVGSNGVLLPVLEAAAIGRGLPTLFHTIVNPVTPAGHRVFKSPSNRWFHDQTIRGRKHLGFHSQIQEVIASGHLLL